MHSHAHAPPTRGRTIHWAHLYDVVTSVLSLGRERAMRQLTLDLAQVRPGETVLDVGCGTGTLTIAAKQRVGTVHGIDPALEMIHLAKQKAERAGVDINFQVGVIEALPFPDDHFDLVLSSLMLHHLPDDLKRAGFREIRRVLKPGGRFLAVDFAPPTLAVLSRFAAMLFGHEMMGSDVRQLASMMEDAGFTDVEAGPTRYRMISFVRGKVAKEAAGAPLGVCE
jgi:ubiquinone/menaquinone biosynthesis C-methylase UbiE